LAGAQEPRSSYFPRSFVGCCESCC
jgi:hypothetical protein